MISHELASIRIMWQGLLGMNPLVLHVSWLLRKLIVHLKNLLELAGVCARQVIFLTWVINDIVQAVRVAVWTILPLAAGVVQWRPHHGVTAILLRLHNQFVLSHDDGSLVRVRSIKVIAQHYLAVR